MKNIFKIVFFSCLACLFVFFASSCSESDKVNDALENTRALDQISADVYINAYVKHGALQGRFKVSERIECAGDIAKVEHSNQERTLTNVVYTDGRYAYFDGNKQNILEYNKYNGSYTAFTDSLLNFKMEQSLFEKIECNDAAGKLTVKKTFDEKADKDAFDEIIKPFAAHIESRFNANVSCNDCKNLSKRCEKCEIKNVDYDGLSIELLIKDGYVERIRMKVNMYATLASLDTVLELDIEMNINSPGSDVVVTLPNGYDSYKQYEMDKAPDIVDWFNKK